MINVGSPLPAEMKFYIFRKSIIIPKTVTTIKAKAFTDDISLTSVIIRLGLETLGNKAFDGCTNLADITIKSKKVTSVGKNVFKDIQPTVIIKVKSSMLAEYKTLFKGKGLNGKATITSI